MRREQLNHRLARKACIEDISSFFSDLVPLGYSLPGLLSPVVHAKQALANCSFFAEARVFNTPEASGDMTTREAEHLGNEKSFKKRVPDTQAETARSRVAKRDRTDET